MENPKRIIENLITYEEVKALLTFEPEDIVPEKVYILPEDMTGNCLINEFSPDIKKIASREEIPCDLIVDKDNYSYLALRDAEIMIPFILSLSSAAIYDLLKYAITMLFINKDNLKVRIITKKRRDTKYRKIVIKGSAKEVLQALETLKEEE